MPGTARGVLPRHGARRQSACPFPPPPHSQFRPVLRFAFPRPYCMRSPRPRVGSSESRAVRWGIPSHGGGRGAHVVVEVAACLRGVGPRGAAASHARAWEAYPLPPLWPLPPVGPLAGLHSTLPPLSIRIKRPRWAPYLMSKHSTPPHFTFPGHFVLSPRSPRRLSHPLWCPFPVHCASALSCLCFSAFSTAHSLPSSPPWLRILPSPVANPCYFSLLLSIFLHAPTRRGHDFAPSLSPLLPSVAREATSKKISAQKNIGYSTYSTVHPLSQRTVPTGLGLAAGSVAWL